VRLSLFVARESGVLIKEKGTILAVLCSGKPVRVNPAGTWTRWGYASWLHLRY